MPKKKSEGLYTVFELLRAGRMRDGAELLYREHYNKVYSIAFSITRDEGKSEDVVHNVIRRILELKIENAPTRCELSWLYTVTKNETLGYLNAVTPAASFDDMPPIACEDKSIADFVDMDAYYGMLKGLGEKRRRVVTLKVLGGYTHREIADITGQPIGTVMWLYNTSIKQLRISLGSMLALILAVGAVFAERLAYYVNLLADSPSYEGGASTVIDRASLVALLLTLGCIILVSSTLFAIHYLNSDKLSAPAQLRSKSTQKLKREYIIILVSAISVILIAIVSVILIVYNSEEKPTPHPYGVADSRIYFSRYDGESVNYGSDTTSYEYYFELAVGEEYLFNFEVTYRNGKKERATSEKTRLIFDEDTLSIEYIDGLGYKLVPLSDTGGTAILVEHTTKMPSVYSGPVIVIKAK